MSMLLAFTEILLTTGSTGMDYSKPTKYLKPWFLRTYTVSMKLWPHANEQFKSAK